MNVFVVGVEHLPPCPCAAGKRDFDDSPAQRCESVAQKRIQATDVDSISTAFTNVGSKSKERE